MIRGLIIWVVFGFNPILINHSFYLMEAPKPKFFNFSNFSKFDYFKLTSSIILIVMGLSVGIIEGTINIIELVNLK